MFWPLVSLWYFGGSFVWVAFLFAGEWLMSSQFQRVRLPPPSVANYGPISWTPTYCPKFLSVWCWFVFGVFWNAEVCFQPPSLLIGKVFALVMSALETEQHKLYGYADDSTFVAVVPSPPQRVAVTESINHNLNRVSVWCDLWGMKLNEGNTKIMIVWMSRTVHLSLTPLTPVGKCWRNLTLSYWGWHLMLRWPFRCTFALFPVL